MPINTPIPLESTARITLPDSFDASLFTRDPYFQTPALWEINSGSSNGLKSRLQGGQIVYNNGNGVWNNINFINPLRNPVSFVGVVNIGYIITVEGVEKFNGNANLTMGEGLPPNQDGDRRVCFNKSGRFQGVAKRTNNNNFFSFGAYGPAGTECVVKELFFFNADKYKYTDFLESVPKIITGINSPKYLVTRSASPKYGFSARQLTDLIVGKWLGNMLLYSEEINQNAWTKGGVSVGTNAGAAPDGTNTAESFNASGSGQFGQTVPDNVSVIGTKTFSIWLKSSSGTPQADLRLYDNVGLLARAQTVDLSTTEWTRCQITADIPTVGCRVEVGLSGRAILGWGAQLTDGVEEGVYTKTTTAMAPVGTPPEGATEVVISANGILGDRLENVAWDGKFTTPIAWVCTQTGFPGTWSSVYLFDLMNSNPDPYFYGKFDAAEWKTEIGSGTGTITLSPELGAVITCGTSASAILVRSGIKCIVPYELVTIEYNCTKVAGSTTIRPGSSPHTPTLGARAVDLTMLSTSTADLRVGGLTASSELTLKELVVKPKYPFFGKTPPSFSAALTPAPGTYDLATGQWWNVGTTVSYAAGNLTFVAANARMIQQFDSFFIPGKTYRIRVNIVTNPAGAVFKLALTNINESAWIQEAIICNDGTTGVKEITFTVNTVNAAPLIKMLLINTTVQGVVVNYVRIYQE
jgi:hypothetical protein